MKSAIITILCKIRDLARTLSFYWNALRYPMKPIRGITIVATFSDGASLSKVMRDFAYALKKAEIPFQTFDLTRHPSVPIQDVSEILTKRENFRSLRFTHIVEMNKSPFPRFRGTRRAVVSFWETLSGYEEVHGNVLRRADILIGMSDFNANYFSKLATLHGKKAVKVLYPFQFPVQTLSDPTILRCKYGLPRDAFIVFFNFDAVSMERKNPKGIIRAFAEAFPVEANTYLLFKTMHAKLFPKEMSELRQLAHELGISSRFSTIDSYIPQSDLYGLITVCDVYMSLHRGEGFGLGVAEAMSVGKPVVVTNWSATTEFCNSSNSIPIPYKMIPPNNDDPLYSIFFKGVTAWADADISMAATALRKLYKNPEQKKIMGKNAQMFIAEHFAPEKFKRHINFLLDS